MLVFSQVYWDIMMLFQPTTNAINSAPTEYEMVTAVKGLFSIL